MRVAARVAIRALYAAFIIRTGLLGGIRVGLHGDENYQFLRPLISV